MWGILLGGSDLIKPSLSLASSDTTLAGKKQGPPHHCQVGVETLVSHLAFVDTQGGAPLYCWVWVGVWLCARPIGMVPLWVGRTGVFIIAPLTASLT